MRAHVITAGKVTNTIEVESLDFMPGLVDASNGGKIGDAWNGLVFSEPTIPFDNKKLTLLQEAKEAKSLAFYSNVTIPFPVDDKEIHFRNETDRANIGDKILKAFMQVTAGNGASSIKFTPVDKVEVTMTCLQLLTAFTGLAEGKDQLFYAYNDVIADIRAASDTDELDAAETALNAL